jgi:pyridoxamine 5'-phosphate oxidase
LRNVQDYERLDASLDDPLPGNPTGLLARWFLEAAERQAQPNPTAASLATVDRDGHPSARMVILRGLDHARGRYVLYTDRGSRKGQELAAHPFAALIVHWDALGRQVRIEGPVTLASDRESDAYFAGRPRESQLAAWASEQSRTVESRARLLEELERQRARFGDDPARAIPRPPGWGGYCVWAERIELWVGQPGRVHDRALWTRKLAPAADGYEASDWQVARLQP